MTFSKFMQLLYGFAGDFYENQEEFFKDINNSAVSESIDDLFSQTTQGTISKYMTGALKFTSIAKKILANSSKENLEACFERIFKNDEQIRNFEMVLRDNRADFEYLDEVGDIVEYYYKLIAKEASTRKKKSIHKKENVQNNTPDITKHSLASMALNSKPNEILKLLKGINDEFTITDDVINKNLPDKIKKDFEYKIMRNRKSLAPELIAKTKDAYLNHDISYNFQFNSIEEGNRFVRSFQKANILKKQIEIKPNKIERYIDDFKDEYYDHERYKHFIGPINTSFPTLNMSLTLDNNHYHVFVDDIILKEKSINEDIITFTNENDDNWIYVNLDIDCSKLEDNKASQNMKLGIKKKYINQVDCFKEFYKADFLMSDKSTRLILFNKETNKNFINTVLSDKNTYSDDNYSVLDKIFEAYNHLSEVQKITGISFEFNQEEFEKNILPYDLTYYCLIGTPKTIKDVFYTEVKIEDNELQDYKKGKRVSLINELDSTILFNKKITFDKRQIILEDAEVIELFKNDDQQYALLKTDKIKIK